MLSRRRVLIVGGYGTFGTRAAERLANDARNDITIAGRDLAAAERAAATLQASSKARISSARFDASAPDTTALAVLAPAVVYNASGPFQTQDYALARAAIATRAHYVDLADARTFVTGINTLDADARRADVLVVAGASSVPGLSSAVVDQLLPGFSRLDSLRYAIVPGNSFDPGIATTASILSYVGKPFTSWRNGKSASVHGWQGLERRIIDGCGARWLGHCDVPDLELFPRRYPGLATIDFKAGLEVPMMHFGLWALSWLVRGGLLNRAERLAGPLLRIKQLLRGLGSETGLMVATFDGVAHDGRRLSLTWQIVARENHGPYIPQMPATALTRQLLDGTLTRRGAMPCVGLVSLADILVEADGLAIDSKLIGAPVLDTTAAAIQVLRPQS